MLDVISCNTIVSEQSRLVPSCAVPLRLALWVCAANVEGVLRFGRWLKGVAADACALLQEPTTHGHECCWVLHRGEARMQLVRNWVGN